MASYNYEKLLQKNKLEKNHYENMKILEKELADWKIEMLNHFKSINELISNGDYDTLKNKTGTQDLFPSDDYILSGNAVVDLILKQKTSWGKQKNISFQINIQKMETLTMEDTDIVCLFSNLLDNACEACEALPPQRRYVYLEIKNADNYLLIKTQNPYSKINIDAKNKLHTTKNNHKLHGRGIGCMKSVAQKYEGNLQYDTDDNVFTVKIVLKVL